MYVISDTLRDEFYRANFFSQELVYIGLRDGTGNQSITSTAALRLATGGINVPITEVDSVTRSYLAQGDFLGFSSVTEEFDVKLGKTSFTLSGANLTMVNNFLNKDFEGSPVQITRVFLDYDDLTPLGSMVVFDGYIYNVSIAESEVSCQITVDCATLWSDFDRRSGRMTDNNSNWTFLKDTSDRSFDKTAIIGNKEFLWGKL
jgi:hypothetical protein